MMSDLNEWHALCYVLRQKRNDVIKNKILNIMEEDIMKKLIGILSVMLLLLGVGSAGATVIDFESFATGTVIGGSGVFSDLEFSAGSNDVLRAVAQIPGPEFSGRMSAASFPFTHDTPFRADFLISGVNSVSVVMGDYNADADNLFVRAYNSSNVLLNEATYFLPGAVYGGPTMTVVGTDIAYVVFGSTGEYANSVFFDNFTYNATNNAVPEPTTLLLFGLGLIGLAGLKRKK